MNELLFSTCQLRVFSSNNNINSVLITQKYAWPDKFINYSYVAGCVLYVNSIEDDLLLEGLQNRSVNKKNKTKNQLNCNFFLIIVLLDLWESIVC